MDVDVEVVVVFKLLVVDVPREMLLANIVRYYREQQK